MPSTVPTRPTCRPTLTVVSDPEPDLVRLVAIRDTPLDVAEVLDALDDDGAGGLTLFVGRVRDHDGGKGVVGLDYSAHPTALTRLEDVCRRVADEHDVRGVAAVHRVGALRIGDLAVVVATTAAHRGDAFAASRALIDTLKAEVPIWKHQLFDDETEEWVGAP
ncbi:molybdenum cofactor biosynthesis protein MoaE [Nocardioides oleivorans]|uniref:Molybdenum cofactor biosynthesis protein MoaE n=1 Tax=Nocardioides oleivorans TaxID=273676 RepID=A0A4V1RKN7_9ACTN|nr:molybdenum cofactor biosynthesis protein MoaE [Nocardioides oleivorans]